MNIKKAFFAFSVAAGLLPGCASNKTDKEVLVIYSPHGKDLLSDFEQQFEAQNPKVDIQWLDMGSQEILDRISTESQNAQADLWWGAPSTMFINAEKAGLLEKYKPSWANEVPSSAKSKDDYWFGTFSTPEVIAFNDNTLNHTTAPRNWEDIVGPQWHQKIVLRNPMASGTLRTIFCAMIARSVTETGKEDQGWLWLKKLDSNVALYAADPTQMYGKLGGENKAVTLWNMPDMVLQKSKNSLPFGYNFPDKGTVVLTDAIAMVKGTKHLKLAEKFYEFVTSKSSLITEANKYYRIPSRTDIAKADLPGWIGTSTYKTMDVDWELVAKNESAWMKKWDSEIKTNK